MKKLAFSIFALFVFLSGCVATDLYIIVDARYWISTVTVTETEWEYNYDAFEGEWKWERETTTLCRAEGYGKEDMPVIYSPDCNGTPGDVSKKVMYLIQYHEEESDERKLGYVGVEFYSQAAPGMTFNVRRIGEYVYLR